MKKIVLILALGLPVAAVTATMPTGERPMGLVRIVERVEAATTGQVMEVDLDRNGAGQLVYEVDVVQGRSLREVRVHAVSGRILSNSPARVESLFWRVYGSGHDSLANAAALSRTLRDLEQRTGGRVIDVDFDIEGGQARYEVELSTDTGVAGLYLDPRTGRRLDFVVDD